MAYSVVGVDKDVICKAVEFLINDQQSDGKFREGGTIIHMEMIVRNCIISWYYL